MKRKYLSPIEGLRRPRKRQAKEEKSLPCRLILLFCIEGLEETVCGFLHAADLAHMASTCREVNRIVSGPAILPVWQHILDKFQNEVLRKACLASHTHNILEEMEGEHPKQILRELLHEVPQQVAEAKEEADESNYPGVSDDEFTVVEPFFKMGTCEVAWSYLQPYFYGTGPTQDLYQLYATPSW